jgi:hypothetical protein
MGDTSGAYVQKPMNRIRSATEIYRRWQITRVLQGQRQATYTLHHNRGTNRFTVSPSFLIAQILTVVGLHRRLLLALMWLHLQTRRIRFR